MAKDDAFDNVQLLTGTTEVVDTVMIYYAPDELTTNYADTPAFTCW